MTNTMKPHFEAIAYYLEKAARATRQAAEETGQAPVSEDREWKAGDTIGGYTYNVVKALDGLPAGTRVGGWNDTRWTKDDAPASTWTWSSSGNQWSAESISGYQPLTVDRIGPAVEEDPDDAPEPRMPEMGDTVTSKEEYDALPARSIAAADAGSPIEKETDHQWYREVDRSINPSGTTRTVLRVGRNAC